MKEFQRQGGKTTLRGLFRSVLHQRRQRRTKAGHRWVEAGATTIDFVFALFWTFVVLFAFVQIALVGYTWQVTGYAAYASARARIVGKLFNGDYKDVAENVMERSLPDNWGKTWIVQEIPIFGVQIFYGKKILGIPVPVWGKSPVPYSKLNPFDPAKRVWSIGDNN